MNEPKRPRLNASDQAFADQWGHLLDNDDTGRATEYGKPCVTIGEPIEVTVDETATLHPDFYDTEGTTT